MHLQPIFLKNDFVTVNGSRLTGVDADCPDEGKDVGKDIFERGVCLPSDIKMTAEEQDRIIEVIRACFE